jgi:hypothetical protein
LPAVHRPASLVGTAQRGGFICEEWDLRITQRCLRDDLGRDADSDFGDLLSLDIVKALVRERRFKTHGGRQVRPLTCGCEVWVVAHGNDHRGATWYDEKNRVVWLLAYGLHRSGEADDFFPYCKEIDAAGELMPTIADVARLNRERDRWFVYALAIEAPRLLLKAREEGPQRAILGGRHGVAVEVEVADDLQGTTIAVDATAVPFGLWQIILVAFHADGDWIEVPAMPSRALEPNEIAWCHDHERIT